MANLGPVFCKMSVSIWIREKTFFSALIFTFLATKFGLFWGSSPNFRNPGSTGEFFRNPGSNEQKGRTGEFFRNPGSNEQKGRT